MPADKDLKSISPPFEIGLSKISACDWFPPDTFLKSRLTEKNRLLKNHHTEVFQQTPNSPVAQQDALEVIVSHLGEHASERYAVHNNLVHIEGIGAAVRVNDQAPPLQVAATLVSDDLAIMERDDDAWRLTAGCICFPSSWRLRDKIGKKMEEVHGSVPGFGSGARNAALITRIFDHLKTDEILARENWGIYADQTLYHPPYAGNRAETLSKHGTALLHLRRERQTLRKLAKSGAILFTIRISFQSMKTIMDNAQTAATLARYLQHMTPEQAAYKDLDLVREQLLSELTERP